jgi:hypothetical protein
MLFGLIRAFAVRQIDQHGTARMTGGFFCRARRSAGTGAGKRKPIGNSRLKGQRGLSRVASTPQRIATRAPRAGVIAVIRLALGRSGDFANGPRQHHRRRADDVRSNGLLKWGLLT